MSIVPHFDPNEDKVLQVFLGMYVCYRPQRKLRKGNVFTGVCLSRDWGSAPGTISPWDCTLPHHAPPQLLPPGCSHHTYGQQVSGTHPTGMHSC